jgi:hypothetical protein
MSAKYGLRQEDAPLPPPRACRIGVAMSGDDFNWGEGNSNVVLRAYGSVAVHENPYGDVVVRQERGELEEDDHWVVIPVQDAELIAKAIVDKAKEIKKGWAADRPPPPAEPEREPRLALPAPNGRMPTVPQNRNSGTSTKAEAAHG